MEFNNALNYFLIIIKVIINRIQNQGNHNLKKCFKNLNYRNNNLKFQFLNVKKNNHNKTK